LTPYTLLSMIDTGDGDGSVSQFGDGWSENERLCCALGAAGGGGGARGAAVVVITCGLSLHVNNVL
jgi:hypothetical protein